MQIPVHGAAAPCLCLYGGAGGDQEDVTGNERWSLSGLEQPGAVGACGGCSRVMGSRAVEPKANLALPNIQFILLPKRVGSWKGAPGIQKIAIWSLGFRFVIQEPGGSFISVRALRVAVNDSGSH